jgi:hypothetical protein
MMNETRAFPMPELLSEGAEQMLHRAKANGLVVPLRGYEIHVQGASPRGLSPQQWVTMRQFWTLYFSAGGASLVSYSAQCGMTR